MTQIVQLGSVDENDERYEAFVEALATDNARVVYILEKKDGSIHIGTNSTNRGDVLYDLYRLQKVCQHIVDEVE